MRKIGSPFQRFSQRIAGLGPVSALDAILFPPACVGCRSRVAASRFLCSSCLSQLAVPDPAVLALLSPLFESGAASVRAAWYTEPGGPVRRIVHAIKYGYRPALARWAGQEAAQALPVRDWDAIVPLPLHRTRRMERGFNQAELIALGVQDVVDVPIQPILRRRMPRRSQTTNSVLGRRAIPEGTFQSTRDPSGLRLLLVDDVVTTGSTVNVASRALLSAGATQVDVVSVAVSRRPGSP